MIINFFLENRYLIYKNKKLIKFILLVLSTFLFDVSPNRYNISSDNLLYENLIYNNKIVPSVFKDDFFQIKSPARTILILIDKKDVKFVNLIYGSLKFINPCLKEIVVTYKRPLTSKYFIIINLNFGNDNFTKIHPISNLQPNSDLLYISIFYFPIKLFYSYTDLFNLPDINYPNTVYINLEYSRENIKQFLLYIKTLSFIDSFNNGSYFYVPFTNSKIDILQVFPFCVCIFLLEILDWVLKFKTARSWLLILNLVFFIFAPWTCFLSLFFPELKVFLMVMYFCINFRYGFILFVICYLQNICKLFFYSEKLRK